MEAVRPIPRPPYGARRPFCVETTQKGTACKFPAMVQVGSRKMCAIHYRSLVRDWSTNLEELTK